MFQAGYLANFMHCWDDLASGNDILLSGVQYGVHLPKLAQVPSFEKENYCMPWSHECFISTEVCDMLKSGAIEQCTARPTCVSPIRCVPKKGVNKLRLIIDLRGVNQFIDTPSFKYEDINVVLDQIRQGDELVSVDLRNGFQHVLVHPDDRDLLGFKWKGVYYRYKVLPFGLSCSPYYFCKILRVVANYLRTEALRVCFYMDDILLMAQAGDMVRHRELMLLTLQRLGWQVNWGKSDLSPSQELTYIGYRLITNDQSGFPQLRIPIERIRKLRKDISRLLLRGCTTARCLARIAGQCVSMAKAVLPAKLLLRNIYRLLHQRVAWEDMLRLDAPTIKDLQWWFVALENWNGRDISTRPVEMQIETDASQTGWGANIIGSGKQAAGFWDMTMSLAPSNARELMAVIMTVLSFKEDLQNKAVQILTDNITTAAYIMHLGGPSPGLSSMVTNLWTICYELNIELTARFLAGVDNQRADYLSRVQAQHEWKLHPAIFKILDQMWGPHTIDRFASMSNRCLPTYNSRFWDPWSSGVDALAQNGRATTTL
jgi:hypothetical protein